MSAPIAVHEAQAYREHQVSARDGLRLYVRDYGRRNSDRPPLLCLPGFTRDSRDFHDLALRYARERRAVCPDLLGRGRSDYAGEPTRYAPTAMLEDVLDVMDALGVERAVVVGASFGGFLAMGLGAARPRSLAGVILNDVGPDVDRKETARIAGYIAEHRPQPNWQAAATHARETLGKGWSRQDDETWLRLVRQSYSEKSDGTLELDHDPKIGVPLEAIVKNDSNASDLWRLFGALKLVPTLVLRGALSRILTPDTLARMAREKPALVAVTVPGIGHMPLLDEPEALEAIDGFLARL